VSERSRVHLSGKKGF